MLNVACSEGSFNAGRGVGWWGGRGGFCAVRTRGFRNASAPGRHRTSTVEDCRLETW